ncbi:HigA family addiction module antitoxin [Quisquiliibacterium transsilvanicum]|nr:HigA family addiction module antitoxin [Quisquiliibacterium transsilvanicum]
MSRKRSELRTQHYEDVASNRQPGAVHPGHVLLTEFIEPLGITRYRVAKSIGVQQRRIDEFCTGERAVTADTAVRLGLSFGVDPQFWLNVSKTSKRRPAHCQPGAGLALTEPDKALCRPGRSRACGSSTSMKPRPIAIRVPFRPARSSAARSLPCGP